MKRAYAIAVLSILGGLLVHLMVFLIIRVESPIFEKPDLNQHKVRFIGNLNDDAAPTVLEQAALNDSSPLFMPTRWNLVSEMSGVASLQSATEIFAPFGPSLAIYESRPTAPVRDTFQSGSQSARLPQGSAFFLSRYGRTMADQPVQVSEGVSCRISSVNLPDANTDFLVTLPVDMQTAAPEALWNPVQLFLQLQGGVPVGLPLVAQSSGFADWDTSLQGYYTGLDFYSRLKDGYYQIWVYP